MSAKQPAFVRAFITTFSSSHFETKWARNNTNPSNTSESKAQANHLNDNTRSRKHIFLKKIK